MRAWSYRGLAAVSVAACAVLSSAAAQGAEIHLQNDSFVEDGGEVGWQGGFKTGEEGASRLGPVNEPFTIDSVQFLYGGLEPASDSVTLIIYEDTGAADPGQTLHNAAYELTPSNSALQTVDLSASNLLMPSGGSIRVSLQFSHESYPCIARDVGGIESGRNWINDQTYGWIDSELAGLEGDWIIRATVITEGGTGGGGTGGSGEGGSGTGGSGEGGTGATGTGGSGQQACVPGETQQCVGPGACIGGQTCQADGNSWSSCECGGAQQTPTSTEDEGGCSISAAGSRTELGLPAVAATLGLLGARRRRLRASR